jgi:uncharacterized membrane protein YadS
MFRVSFVALFLLLTSVSVYAQEAAKKPSMLESLFPFFIIFGIFYFLIIRKTFDSTQKRRSSYNFEWYFWNHRWFD